MSRLVPVIAGNWKMYRGGAAGCELAERVAKACAGLTGVELVVAPPFTALAAVAEVLDGTAIEVAGQNFHPKPEGAFTGEVSAPMLLETGCRWVIIGHSERRQFFGETDASVSEKVKVAMSQGLRPIACIGETLEERERGQTLEVCFRQLDAFAEHLGQQPGFGVIAYEPVWAIGTGKVAGPDQAQEVHAALRARLKERFGDLAGVTRILYGGSVKPDNAAALLACPDVNGALVGGASLDAASFAQIAAAAVRN